MKKATAPVKVLGIALPSGITKSDLESRPYPKSGGDAAWRKHHKDNVLVEPRELTMHYTERFGWVITTLFISSGRQHGIEIKNGGLVTVGKGPHIKCTVRVRLYEDRLPDLQPYLDFYNKGLEKAHETRDALSTKRMTSATRRRASWSSFF